MESDVRALPDGLVLRTIRPDEVDQTAELLVERGEPADGEDLRLVLDDPDAGLPGTAVVLDGGRVVATASLLDEQLDLCGHAVPAGQVELVATAVSHEGRGLARALMQWCHDRSAARGHVVQVMIGIPNFYRRFGYSYAMPIPRVHTLTGSVEAPPGVGVRRATAADIDVMAELQDAEQRGADLRMPHSDGCWRWLVTRSGSEQWVAERDGVAIAVGRVLPDEGVVGELAATDPAGALAVLAHAAEAARATDHPLYVQPRGRGRAHDAVVPYLDQGDLPEWFYARVPDLAALLEHLGPLLGERLRDSGLGPPEGGGDQHQVLLSTYTEHLRVTVGTRGVASVQRGGREQAPVSKGGSGLAAEAVPGLLLGPYGALGLEEREPDCHLGRQRDLMGVLFPPVTSDLLTFYLAV
ncbi:MAG TPA: GNAT family N-acetyltransferase [Actinomycetes bacterium]|nr:GNAT family N-acetyltransferase [Actinomycetes bacterium]